MTSSLQTTTQQVPTRLILMKWHRYHRVRKMNTFCTGETRSVASGVRGKKATEEAWSIMVAKYHQVATSQSNRIEQTLKQISGVKSVRYCCTETELPPVYVSPAQRHTTLLINVPTCTCTAEVIMLSLTRWYNTIRCWYS